MVVILATSHLGASPFSMPVLLTLFILTLAFIEAKETYFMPNLIEGSSVEAKYAHLLQYRFVKIE